MKYIDEQLIVKDAENLNEILSIAFQNNEIDELDRIVSEIDIRDIHTQIKYAIDAKQNELAKFLITKMGPENIDYKNILGHTALYYAVVADNLDIAKFLLSKGSDYEEKTSDENPRDLIGIAIEFKSKNIIKYIVEHLRNKRLFSDLATSSHQQLQSVSLDEEQQDLVKSDLQLLKVEEKGKYLNTTSKIVSSIFENALSKHQAVEQYYYKTEVKESYVSKDDDNLVVNPIFILSETQNPTNIGSVFVSRIPNPEYTKVKLLELGEESEELSDKILDKEKITCDNNLHILAANNGDPELAEELILSGKYGIDDVNKRGFTPLLLAVTNINPELVFVLLKYGADVNCVEKLKQFKLSNAYNENDSDQSDDSFIFTNNPLMYAMELFVDRSKQEKITQKDVEYDRKILKIIFLLLNHPKINFQTPGIYSRTLLHLAVDRGMHEVVIFLLENKKIEINAQDSFQNTALHIATEKQDEKMVEILLANGALSEIKNLYNKTPVDIMVESYKNVKIKINENVKRVNLITLNSEQETSLSIIEKEEKLLIIKEQQVEISKTGNLLKSFSENYKKKSPLDQEIIEKDPYLKLHYALQNKASYEEIRELVVNLKEANRADANRISFLHLAAENGDEKIFQLIYSLSAKMANFLNKFDQRPLHIAVINNNYEIVKFLANRPNVSLFRDMYDNSPVDYAVINNNLEVFKLLIPQFIKEMEKYNPKIAIHLNELNDYLPMTFRRILQNEEMKKALLEYRNLEGYSVVDIVCKNGFEKLIDLFKEYKIELGEFKDLKPFSDVSVETRLGIFFPSDLLRSDQTKQEATEPSLKKPRNEMPRTQDSIASRANLFLDEKFSEYINFRFSILKEDKSLEDVEKIKSQKTIFLTPLGSANKNFEKDKFPEVIEALKENEKDYEPEIERQVFFSFVNEYGNHWNLVKHENNNNSWNSQMISCIGDGACGAHAMLNAIIHDEELKKNEKIIKIAHDLSIDLSSKERIDSSKAIDFVIGVIKSDIAENDANENIQKLRIVEKLTRLKENLTNQENWVDSGDIEVFSKSIGVMVLNKNRVLNFTSEKNKIIKKIVAENEDELTKLFEYFTNYNNSDGELAIKIIDYLKTPQEHKQSSSPDVSPSSSRSSSPLSRSSSARSLSPLSSIH